MKMNNWYKLAKRTFPLVIAGLIVSVLLGTAYNSGSKPNQVVLSTYVNLASQTTLQTVVTPNSGKKLRVVSIEFNNASAGAAFVHETYFGTGTNITTTIAQAVSYRRVNNSGGQSDTFFVSWPVGEGPIAAAADDVLSMRSGSAASVYHTVIHYTEE